MTDTTEDCISCDLKEKYGDERLQTLADHIQTCYDESIHQEEVLGICYTIIDEHGNHVGTAKPDNYEPDTQAVTDMVKLIGDDIDLWDFVNVLAFEIADMDKDRNKRREERLGWTPGKVVAGANVSEEEVERVLEAIKNADLDCDCLKTA